LHERAQATGFDALVIGPLTGDAFAHVAGLLIERSALLRERSERTRQSAADLVRRSDTHEAGWPLPPSQRGRRRSRLRPATTPCLRAYQAAVPPDHRAAADVATKAIVSS
jgi:hypothetical protein